MHDRMQEVKDSADVSVTNCYYYRVFEFAPFTWEHFLPIIACIVLASVAIYTGRRSGRKRQVYIGAGLALLPWGFMFVGSVMRLIAGTYDITHDLPVYLCRIVAWMLPFVMFWRNKWWLGVFYFWILAGTFQGIVTPDLNEGFPDYYYFRYWALHCGLVVTVLYAVLVYEIRIRWRDMWRAILIAQVYLILVHVLNVALGSNYSYTVAKPEGPSILDIFGDWPWYILGGEMIMILFFLLLLMPFLMKGRRPSRVSKGQV